MTAAALYVPPQSWHQEPPPDPVVDWLTYFDSHRDLSMVRQSQSWTCSACSIDWVARATGLDPGSNREQVVGELGYPTCINADYGLMDTQCAIRLMTDWGPEVRQEWCDFDRAYELCTQTTGLLNSVTWQHFVAIRGIQNGNLWIANSAPGYRNIWEVITRPQWNSWAGSWQIVWLVP